MVEANHLRCKQLTALKLLSRRAIRVKANVKVAIRTLSFSILFCAVVAFPGRLQPLNPTKPQSGDMESHRDVQLTPAKTLLAHGSGSHVLSSGDPAPCIEHS
jgi:hypothetical protein